MNDGSIVAVMMQYRFIKTTRIMYVGAVKCLRKLIVRHKMFSTKMLGINLERTFTSLTFK